MTDRYSLDEVISWNEEEPCCDKGLPQVALDYLRFILDEAPEQLLLSLAEVLLACPSLTGVVIPLYESALSSNERRILSRSFPQAATYLNDSQGARLPWDRLRA